MSKVRIETKNSASKELGKEGEKYEVCGCLAQVIRKIEQGNKEGPIHDTNGNLVGSSKLTNR